MAEMPRSKPITNTPCTQAECPRYQLEAGTLCPSHGLPIATYAQTISKLLSGREDADARLYTRDAHERMAPRDPVEEMLVTQMILTHIRVLHLTGLLELQTTRKEIKTMKHKAKTRRTNMDQTIPPGLEPSLPVKSRRFRLSPKRMASLRSSAQRVRLLKKSTGPKIQAGKARSRLNTTKHRQRKRIQFIADEKSFLRYSLLEVSSIPQCP